MTKVSVLRLLLCLTVVVIPAPAFGQDASVYEWLQPRIGAERFDFDHVVEIQRWLQAPLPNTYIVLAIGSKDVQPGEGFSTGRGYFVLVFLVQSASKDRLVTPKELSFLNVGSVRLDDPTNRDVSIDVGSYRIRENEYAFGIRQISAQLGNKGGLAFEILTLYRPQGSKLKPIFSDFTWGYSKYSEPGLRSCNVEAVIVSGPGRQGEFFNLVRKQTRVYLGDSRNPPFRSLERSAATEIPVDSCSLIGDMQFPNTHKWDPAKGAYVEPGPSFLNADLWGKGIFIGRDR
jgi:hypothetical protein